MTSPLKDSAGVEFDPAKHQHAKDGAPRTTKDGRFFLKGKRGPGAKKSPAGPTAARDNLPAADSKSVAPAPSPSPVNPGELPPLTMQPATERDILGDFAKPTIAPDAAEPVPEAAPPPEGAAPLVSTVGADPAEAAPGAAADDSFAVVCVTVAEDSARLTIDAQEWELAELERARLVAKLNAVFAEEGIGQNMSPKGALMAEIVAVCGRRMHKPKTRVWLVNAWGWLMGLFAPKKEAPKPIDRHAPAAPTVPQKAENSAVAPAKSALAPVHPDDAAPDLNTAPEAFPA